MASSIIQDENNNTVIRFVLPELPIEAIFVVDLVKLLSDTSPRGLNVQYMRDGIEAVVIGEAGQTPLTLPLDVVAVEDNFRFGDVMMFAHICVVLNCANIMPSSPYFGKLVF